MSNKIGRNDPCPCGSGKKYKKCCLSAVQDDAAQRARTQQDLDHSSVESEFGPVKRGLAGVVAALVQEEIDERNAVSDHVRDLIDDEHFDEAETICRKIEADHPEDHLGTELLAEVYLARGKPQNAADHYRRAVAMMDALGPGEYCDCCRARMVKEIRRLDPDHPAPPLEFDPT